MGAEITILDHADRHGSLVDMLKDARELNSHSPSLPSEACAEGPAHRFIVQPSSCWKACRSRSPWNRRTSVLRLRKSSRAFSAQISWTGAQRAMPMLPSKTVRKHHMCGV